MLKLLVAALLGGILGLVVANISLPLSSMAAYAGFFMVGGAVIAATIAILAGKKK